MPVALVSFTRGMPSFGVLVFVAIVLQILHEVILWAVFTPSNPPPYLTLLSLVQFPLMSLMR